MLSKLDSTLVEKLLKMPTRIFSRIVSPITRYAGFTASGLANTLANARGNISAHYDLGNEMFEGTTTSLLRHHASALI